MIKVVIADDEKRFREYMEKVLDWEALGFYITGTASNGEQVLELLEEERPDLALLDINMPKMDGIHLTERMREISPSTYVVFITGYSEFEYARKAVELGVSEYLLKPFSKEELSRVVLKLKEKILKEKKDRAQNTRRNEIIRRDFLNKIVRLDREDKDEIEEYREHLAQLEVQLSSSAYIVTMTQLDREGLELSRDDKKLWTFGIQNILEEMGEKSGKRQYSFLNYEGNLVSIWQGEERTLREIPKFMEEVYETVKRLLGKSITSGVGSLEKDVCGIPDSYRKSLISLQNKFVMENRKVISYEEVLEGEQKADFYRLELNERLLQYLRKNDNKKIEEVLLSAEEEMVMQRYSVEYINAAVMGILSVCLSYIVEMKRSIEEVLGEDFSPYMQLKKMEAMSECFRWLREIYQETADYFRKPHSKRAEEIIQEVETYIETHYTDFSLTADDISEAVFLDISYIRKVFSKYKDYTIQDYITNVRMRAAREKIEEKKYSISEVAEMCGYLDAGYFSKCFKKFYHISPRQYINQLGENGNKEVRS